MTGAIDTFLRSINLRFDLAHADRFAHFRPTGKSAQVVDAVARGAPHRAAVVVAAYGSGKSIAAGAASLLVENAPASRAVLGTLARRFDGVDPKLAAFARERVSAGTRGATFVLEGHQPDVADAVRDAAEDRLGALALTPGRAGNPVSVLDAAAAEARAQGLDRIALVWDEFGRHLEVLAATGQPEDLAVVQQIAEWAARQEAPEASFSLLLHQGFFQYAGNLSQTARNAWRKIEGRFGTVHFVDDSREMYRLIADVVEATRPADLKLPGVKTFVDVARAARRHGLFDAITDTDELAETLRRAYPLAPAALYMLPRLAGRIAQNERTVFGFINDADLARVVSLKDLYDCFAEALEADTGLGGAHRRWLEAESALSKVEGADEAHAIAATALLSLGQSGQRRRVARDTLVFALQAYRSMTKAEAAATVDALIDRKLLLHRHRTDDVSVWHGTDLDLRGRLEEERLRLEPEFDPVAFIAREHPAPAWRPVGHNVARCVRRYYAGAYVRAAELLEEGDAHPVWRLAPGEDGRVVYALPATQEEVDRLERFALGGAPRDPGLVLAVPQAPVPFADVALEAACLARLECDADLIGSDPFAEQEIRHMADAAQESLRRVMQRAVEPVANGPTWFADGCALEVSDDGTLRDELSHLADDRFPETPRINNELVVRRKLSRPMVNARKKLLLGVLERAGQPKLGFGDEMTTPDASTYRTVLERTGLYREASGAWGWAAPEELADDGLRTVWARLCEFFTEEGVHDPAALVSELQSPPCGVRAGVIPVLVGAALSGFAEAVAIRRDGVYLPDILASEVEQLCSEPARFEVEVIALDDTRRVYLAGLVERFGQREAGRGDLIRQAHDALAAWKKQLPEAALRTKRVSKAARIFQRAVYGDPDPVELLLGRLPFVPGARGPGLQALEAVDGLRREIEGIVEGYTASAVEAVRTILALRPDEPGDALDHAQAWGECFPAELLKTEALDQAAKAVLQRAREAGSGRYTEASFARALSAILVGKGFDKWDDRTPQYFAAKLREAAGQAEAAALEADAPSPSMRPLLEGRLHHIHEQLRRASGEEAAGAALARLRGAVDRGVKHGESSRRAF